MIGTDHSASHFHTFPSSDPNRTMLSLMRPVASRVATASPCTIPRVLPSRSLAKTSALPSWQHTFTHTASQLRSASTTTHSTLPPNSSSSISTPFRRRIPLRVSVPLVGLVAGTALYSTSDSFRHRALALRRMLLAAEAVVVTGYDYKFSALYGNRDLKEGDPKDEIERRRRRNRVHKRSAERVMVMMRTNGGIYIKLVSSAVDSPVFWGVNRECRSCLINSCCCNTRVSTLQV